MSDKDSIETIRAFNRFYTNIIGVIDRHVLNSPFSLTEVRVMWEVHHDADLTARKIKNILQVDEGYLSRTVSGLIKRGIITRKPVHGDARSYNLSLTDNGEKVFRELNGQASKEIENLLRPIPENEIHELTRCMMRITDILQGE